MTLPPASIRWDVCDASKTVTIVVDSASLDRSMAPLFEPAIQAVPKDTETVIVDLGNVDHVDSTGLGILIRIRAAVSVQAEIRIINCHPHPYQVLMTANFQRLFTLERQIVR